MLCNCTRFSAPRLPLSRQFSKSRPVCSKFLVAIDGTNESIYATKKASDLMKEGDSGVLIHIVEPLELGKLSSRVSDPAMEEVKEAKQKYVQQLKKDVDKQIKKFNKNFTWVTVEGKPGDQICKYVYENKVDYLLMGDRGRDTSKKLFLGSICNYCVNHAPCSVMIVKDENMARADYLQASDIEETDKF